MREITALRRIMQWFLVGCETIEPGRSELTRHIFRVDMIIIDKLRVADRVMDGSVGCSSMRER
jgi:hypothetical protein